jgi:hypothetical protein
MNFETILQMQKDRSNGVLISQPSIDKLLGHALMRECEAPHLLAKIEQLTQALADKDLALMEQTTLTEKCRQQAETKDAETVLLRAQVEDLQARLASAPVAAMDRTERSKRIAAALSAVKQDYSPDCLRMASTSDYVADAIGQLIDAGLLAAPQQHAQAAQTEINDALDRADAEDAARFGAQAALSTDVMLLLRDAASAWNNERESELDAAMERIESFLLATRQPAPGIPYDTCNCAHIGECDGSCAPYISPQPVAAAVQGDATVVHSAKLFQKWMSSQGESCEWIGGDQFEGSFAQDKYEAFCAGINATQTPADAALVQCHICELPLNGYQQGRASGLEEAAKVIEPDPSLRDDELTTYGKNMRNQAGRIRALNK